MHPNPKRIIPVILVLGLIALAYWFFNGRASAQTDELMASGTIESTEYIIAPESAGRIVEIGPTRAVLAEPAHPYSKALLSVIPVPNPRNRHHHTILQGETPNPIDLPGGCRFHPRCPLAFDRCPQVDPKLTRVTNEHEAACLLVNNS